MSVRSLSDIRRGQAPEFGGKAANLGELTASGIPVPPGFVIGAPDYATHVERCDLERALAPLLAKEWWAEAEVTARELLSSVQLESELASAILGAFADLGSPTVAVRSSAIGEDASGASFAGQYHTKLDASGEEALLHAVLSCWASLWSKAALAYRHRLDLGHVRQGMGVVVQRMVPAEVSGVLFTVDPVARRSDRMLVEVVWGRGEALVSGTDTGVVYRLARDRFHIVDVDNGAGGEEIEAARLEVVWHTAREIEDHFGGPQDIEFGFVEDHLWVFQTRPITTLSPELVEPLKPLGNPSLTERAILPLAVEHYATAPKPLDNLVFVRLVGAVTEIVRRFGGWVDPEDEEVFRKEVWRQAYRLPRHRLTWRVFLTGKEQRNVRAQDWMAWWMAGPEPILREVSAPVDLGTMSDEALFQRADAILVEWETILGDRMVAVGAFRGEFALKTLVTLAVVGKERNRILADLVRGLDTPITESNLALWRLSRKAREDERLLAGVKNTDLADLGRFPEGRALLGAVGEFQSAYGHREGDSWYLSVPTWDRNPTLVWSFLSTMVDQQSFSTDPIGGRRAFAAAKELVARRLAPVPWLRRRFLSLLDRIRSHTLFREQSHFDLTRPLAALQGIAGEWGRRLADRGIIPDPTSVFFLTVEEVRDWILDSPPPLEEVRELLARRRATYQVVNTTWEKERAPRQARGAGLRGIPASPGIASGTARLVRGEHQFHRLEAGDILVAPHTNPSWTPLFAIAAGVVTEVGGPASHAAIVAREYGIPCVMAVKGALESLRDGNLISVDGNRGVILVSSPKVGPARLT